MNRRIRNRTYGGVGGGAPQGPLLPDLTCWQIVTTETLGFLYYHRVTGSPCNKKLQGDICNDHPAIVE
jgi:hypothetical protein